MAISRVLGAFSSRLSRSFVVTVVALLVVGGVGYAAGSDAAGSTVTFCAEKGSGAVTLSKNGACKKKTSPVVVGQTGPQGPQGPPGDAAVVNPGRAFVVLTYDASVDCTTNPGHFCKYATYPWADYGNGLALASYRTDPEGVVHLTGAVAPSNGGGAAPNAVVFYLPAGSRPIDGAHRYVVSNCSTTTSTALVEVDPSGAVSVLAGLCADLSGITFSAR